MKFSVLMSVYKNDNPQFLKLALESIFDNQVLKPDEIVIVFDGPLTAELESVLFSFRIGKEDIVKFYPQPINQGLGEALRIGSEKCIGEYILRMDSDDISNPERFLKQIEYIKKHPEIDVLGTDIAEFQHSLDEKKRVRTCPQYHEGIIKMAKVRNPMNHVTTCIKRSSLINSGGYISLLYLEDYYLWLRMIVSGCKFANILEPLVFVRVGNGFDLKRSSRTRVGGWRVLQNFMLENQIINRTQAFLNMFYISAFVYSPICLKKWLYNLFLRK